VLIGSAAPVGARVQIFNGAPWPAQFRPYCANAAPNSRSPCPFNDRLPDKPADIYPESRNVVESMFDSKNYVVLPGDFSLRGDYSHPVYVAENSDPEVRVTCRRFCGVPSATFRIPERARPAGGGDGHIGVIEPDGTEWDMWQMTYTGPGTASASALARTSILGSGAVPKGGATSGAALAAGLIRFDELERGVIQHALFATTSCVRPGALYPASSDALICKRDVEDAPPTGARFQLTLSDAEIDRLNARPWEKAILRAMHDYGVYIMDTNGESTSPGPLELMWESVSQYASFGRPYPGHSFPGLVTGRWDPAGIDWAKSLRIVSTCYAQEVCRR
jgi:hypothetical protein